MGNALAAQTRTESWLLTNAVDSNGSALMGALASVTKASRLVSAGATMLGGACKHR